MLAINAFLTAISVFGDFLFFLRNDQIGYNIFSSGRLPQNRSVVLISIPMELFECSARRNSKWGSTTTSCPQNEDKLSCIGANIARKHLKNAGVIDLEIATIVAQAGRKLF